MALTKVTGQGLETLSDGVTITTADNTTQLTLSSTEAGATKGPMLELYRNSASPAAGDDTGRINFQAENDAGESITYSQAFSEIAAVGDGVESGRYKVGTMVAGTFRGRMDMTATETIFNEESIDLDFRVESNGNVNMLFVDGGNDKVGIGAVPNATFGSLLYVQGTPAANKPIFSAYSQGNSNKAGIGILNDAGNRGIWTDSNDFLLTTSYEGNSTVHMKIDTSGNITKPLQPSFSVTPSATQSNFAVGSHVTVVFDTEIFDVGSNFASNSFTAPVTGKYQLNMRIDLQNTDTAAGFYQYRISTSNRVYATSFDPDHMDSDTVFYGVNLSQLVDMDANDTASVTIFQSSGTQQSDLGTGSGFNGILVG